MGFREIGELFLESPHQASEWPNRLDMVLALSQFASLAERQPPQHGLEIAVLAATLGKRLDFAEARQSRLILACLLHDIGMFALLPQTLPEEEARLGRHAQAVLLGQSQAPLQQHLNLPRELTLMLDLPHETVDMIRHHHVFANQSGLLPDDDNGPVAPPTLATNLLTLCDVVLSASPERNNRQVRYQQIQKQLDLCTPARFYPELLEAMHILLDSPEALKMLDHRVLVETLYGLFPQEGPFWSPVSSSELFHLCAWLAEQVEKRQANYLLGESRETASLAVRMGQGLDLPTEALGQLAIAGLLHDVSKIALDLEFLTANQALRDKEKESLGEALQCAEQILSRIPGFGAIAQWIGTFHEHLNGKGYPYGRPSNNIPVGARILALADAYVALTRARSYRPTPYRQQDALELLTQNQGKIYDPSLLEILRTVV